MEVRVKDFSVSMDVKNKGIEFDVRDNDGKFRDNCFITKGGLTWCKGKTSRGNEQRYLGTIYLLDERLIP